MAELTSEHTFEGTLDEVFEGICQYRKYPDYLPGVTKTTVLPAEAAGSTCQVRYDLKLIKTFFYTMNMFEEKPTRIHWTLADSNLMKQATGSWDLNDLGDNRVKAIYTLDIAFRGLVPQAIVDQLTKANLPLMMKGFQQLIHDRRNAS